MNSRLGFMFSISVFDWGFTILFSRDKNFLSNFTDIDQKTSFERALEIYNHLNAALEPVDKNCVKKIVCEAGALAKDVGLTQYPIVR